jgi:sugar phosphate isomerase/epimerase
MMFDLGLVSVSFRPLEPKQIAELCRKNDLEYIEWGSDVHAPYADNNRIYEIVELQNELGIKCSSYGTYFKIGMNDASELYGYIDAAKKLGTNILRLWCGNENYTEMTADERDYIIAESKKVAKIAEECDVTLCMECHNKTFTNCLEGALELMKAVDSPNFQMYWQPNQFRTLEENLEYAEKIAKYVKVIHVFNWEGKNKYPLGESIEIWRKYLSYFDGSQKLLLEFMPDGKAESLGAETAALKEIIRELK